MVEMRAASINPSDVKNVAGRMSQTTLPRTPGRDYSGVVMDGPEQWIGREVWGSGGDTGSFSLAEAVGAYRAVEAGTPGRV
ncbi:alcohol dehydrogenase catalytic domain-containing protein, partial [Mycobacterium tuberculosis]|uniref:alcohol dehydrogenase catalytic domain-containing protein n=1 Tax=Mycobacterium tuberculosis TaxID=1773 RepID=UPI003DA806E4